ncbi:MAG: two-component system response regulator BtsR [Desulfobacteraceae bacterium]
MIRALVIDDEVHAREEMTILLTETGLFGAIETCANAFEGLKAINRMQPDVVFLDIQMPQVDGFEMLNMVNQDIMPHIVFVTAFEEYSLKAFEERTLDYLLKPVSSGRLRKTLDKLQQTLAENKPTAFDAEEIKRIPLLVKRRIKFLNMKEVEFISAGERGHYIATAENEFYTDITLKTLEERSCLVRCHKQYLINMDNVKEIALLDNGLGMIITKSGASVKVSRRYLKKIKGMLLI